MNRIFGNREKWTEGLIVSGAMFAILLMYQHLVGIVSESLGDIAFDPVAYFFGNPVEFFGTFFIMICVWLARTENILTWPTGIIGTILIGYFFLQIGLPGQMMLNWAFFLPISIISWYWWSYGGEGRKELPVTRLTNLARVIMVIGIAVITSQAYFAIDYISPGSVYPILDALVVGASIVAQFLLGRKKWETWVLWFGPVNAISIALFYLAGAYLVMALYVAFFVHAAIAIRTWYNESNANG